MLISLSLGSCNCHVNFKIWSQKQMQLLCSRSSQPWVCCVCVQARSAPCTYIIWEKVSSIATSQAVFNYLKLWA